MSHVDEGRLHAYLDGALHAEEPVVADAVEAHLAACADCRARLEEARELRAEADAVLGHVLPADDVPMPPFEEVVARSRVAAARTANGPLAGGARPRRGRPRRMVGLAWAASLTLALGMGWWGRGLVSPPERGVAARPEAVASAAPRPTTDEGAAAPGPRAGNGVARPARLSTNAEAEMEQRPPELAEGPERVQGVESARQLAATSGGDAAGERSPGERVGAAGETARAGEPTGADVPDVAVADAGRAAARLPASVVPAPANAGEARLAARALDDEPSVPAPAAVPAEPVVEETRRRSLALAEFEIAPTPSDSAPVAAGEPADGSVPWRAVDSAEAERWIGGPVLAMPGLLTTEIAVARIDEEPLARTLQLLNDGGWIELIQRREVRQDLQTVARAPQDRQEFAMPPSTGFAEAAGDRGEEISTISIVRNGYRITARAPLPPDSLRQLLNRLR